MPAAGLARGHGLQWAVSKAAMTTTTTTTMLLLAEGEKEKVVVEEDEEKGEAPTGYGRHGAASR